MTWHQELLTFTESGVTLRGGQQSDCATSLQRVLRISRTVMFINTSCYQSTFVRHPTTLATWLKLGYPVPPCMERTDCAG